MKRTISIRLKPSITQAHDLCSTIDTFAKICNYIVRFAVDARCHNKVKLHNLCYDSVKKHFPGIGSQIVINAIARVAAIYKSRVLNCRNINNSKAVLSGKKEVKDPWEPVVFRSEGSVQYDRRIFSIRQDDFLSLYVTSIMDRIMIPIHTGKFQSAYLEQGFPKEGELVCRKGKWYFNLVINLPKPEPAKGSNVVGVHVGEKCLAATSNGTLFVGRELSHERNKFLALRRRLQTNGSRSAMQHLKKASGKERRHVKQINHEVSKAIVAEAVKNRCSCIAMEDLTGIRENIKAGKNGHTLLNRWAWVQLQTFVSYKAKAAGISIQFVDSTGTSDTCSHCLEKGTRRGRRFSCKSCGSLAHADLNEGRNIARLARFATSVKEKAGRVKGRSKPSQAGSKLPADVPAKLAEHKAPSVVSVLA